MRLNRFFTERKNIRIGSSVKLSDSDISHIKKVLRLTKGDKIIVFNGEKEFLATLKVVSKDVIMVVLNELLQDQVNTQDHFAKITLFQGLLRAGKFDTVIEKTTETGITSIVPMETDFSQTKVEVIERKLERWNKLAIAASKQSERISVPEIYQGITFKEVKNLLSDFDVVYFVTIPRKKIAESLEAQPLNQIEVDKFKNNIAFLIGPEGGFSPAEHKMAKEWGLTFVYLDSPVLRSETASIVFTSLFRFIYS